MRTDEVLAKIPGLARQDLYYWESKGMVSPKKRMVGKVRRNDYTEEDFKLIQMIHYHRLATHLLDFPLKEVYRRAQEDLRKGLTLKEMLAR